MTEVSTRRSSILKIQSILRRYFALLTLRTLQAERNEYNRRQAAAVYCQVRGGWIEDFYIETHLVVLFAKLGGSLLLPLDSSKECCITRLPETFRLGGVLIFNTNGSQRSLHQFYASNVVTVAML
eukprot:231430-Ditylum_brightwellii.AAC.1